MSDESRVPGVFGATYPSLKGQVALVTGGASGIGLSIVEQLHAQGAKVGFIDINRQAGEALVARLGEGAFFVAADITDMEALRGAIENVREALGPITILVNNAAHDQRHKVTEVTPDYWDDRIAVNIKHHYFAIQAVMEDMKKAQRGSIINMGSTSWLVSGAEMPVYTTAKSAVMGLTRAFAAELGPYNVRVNSIAPGWIITERQEELWLDEEGEKKLMDVQCLKRRLYPEEIARAVLFFASDEASAFTNQTYIADGGWY